MRTVLVAIFSLTLYACVSTTISPTPSPGLEHPTQVSPTHPTAFAATPVCTEKLVPPVIADVQPSPARPGNEITVTGTGGYIQDSCGGVNESARSFKLFLDNEPVGDLLCYVNHCETRIKLAGSIRPKSHCLSTQMDVCEFQFQVGAE